MIDLLYLAHNRLQFTKASLEVLVNNTQWDRVSRFYIYDDNSEDGTREYLAAGRYPIEPQFEFGRWGGPVAVMRHYLENSANGSAIFGKIDSDTMVPPGWLSDCLDVMGEYPELDLLGIEVFNRVETAKIKRGYSEARHIGGIGLMRTRAFKTLPTPGGRGGRFGFTSWQQDNPGVIKGWIDPSLPVFLLDHLPRQPWRSLSREYCKKGWSREWGPYDEGSREMWSWWCE